MIEAVWSKQRILEVYLNVIEWGVGVFGADAAATHYFGIGASRLSADQAARLAGMVPSPRVYDRNRNAPGLAIRAGRDPPAHGRGSGSLIGHENGARKGLPGGPTVLESTPVSSAAVQRRPAR